MIITLLIRLLQMLVLIAFQVLVLNHIHFLGYATPLVYVAFLLYFPLNANRIGTLFWSFVIGIILDAFSNTPGLTAASMVLAGFVQPNLLHAMAPKDAVEDMVPTYRSMGKWNHVRYIMLIMLIQEVCYFLLESFSFYNYRDLLLTFAGSYAITLVIVLTLESFRGRKT